MKSTTACQLLKAAPNSAGRPDRRDCSAGAMYRCRAYLLLGPSDVRALRDVVRQSTFNATQRFWLALKSYL